MDWINKIKYGRIALTSKLLVLYIPEMRSGCVHLLFMDARLYAAGGWFIADHKAQQAVQYGGNGPAWIPGTGMKVAHAEAESSVWLKPPRGCNHANGGRFEGIFSWKSDAAIVLASFVRCIGWSCNHIVPTCCYFISRRMDLYGMHEVFYQSKMLLSKGLAVM